MNYSYNWVTLAAAIIRSGRQESDKSFLKSPWHDLLLSIVSEYINDRTNIYKLNRMPSVGGVY